MAFTAQQLRIIGVDATSLTSDEAWWRLETIETDGPPGALLVLDVARRHIQAAGGALDDDVRFRERVADALNERIREDGSYAVVTALHSPAPLRLTVLTP